MKTDPNVKKKEETERCKSRHTNCSELLEVGSLVVEVCGVQHALGWDAPHVQTRPAQRTTTLNTAHLNTSHHITSHNTIQYNTAVRIRNHLRNNSTHFIKTEF